MRVSFIGSGNVATHLALALFNRGHVIDQIWSRDIEHAKLLANRVEAHPIDDLGQLYGNANIYIIAVSDDASEDVARQLHMQNAIVMHTSGATPMDVLSTTSKRYGVLWSPQTFVRDVALDYSELPFCIEGNTLDTENSIAEFIGMISNHIFRTDFQQRQYLHLSAVFVNNFTNGLYAVAQRICREHDVPFEILNPLAVTTAKKLQWGDVRYQITGPATRNDKKTLSAHRHLLEDDPEALELYNRMTNLLLEVKNG